MKHIQDYIAVANDYYDSTFEEKSPYTEENCWDWSENNAVKTIMLVKDVLDNNPGNHLTDDALNELYEKLIVDNYFNTYVPDEIYGV